MSKPTREDASLLLQLLAIRGQNKNLTKALRWIFEELDIKSYDEFKDKYPLKSEGNRYIRTFCNNMELLSTLVNKELISEDLVFDLMGSLMWEKLGPIVIGLRKDIEMPRYLENYEVLAKKYPSWAEKNPPKV
ncbi:MAG: DUF4760 domain-containing protein [Candidatus Hodarchaeota archaeon]